MRSSGFTKFSRASTTGLYSNNTIGLYTPPSLLRMIAQIPPSLAGLVPGFTLSSTKGNSISALNLEPSDLRVSSNVRSTINTPTTGTPQASLYRKCSIPSVNLVAITEMDWWEGGWSTPAKRRKSSYVDKLFMYLHYLLHYSNSIMHGVQFLDRLTVHLFLRVLSAFKLPNHLALSL